MNLFTTNKNVYIYLFDGFSDWEIAFLTPELKKNDAINLLLVSDNGQPIISAGGLKITPDIPLSSIDINTLDMLVLPGGLYWEKDNLSELINNLLDTIYYKKSNIAAICAATTYLGQKGYLNNIKHTSVDLGYLKYVAPEYTGEKYYQNKPAVSHDNIITANGTAPIEFTQSILTQLEFNTDYIDKWYQLFKFGIWIE